MSVATLLFPFPKGANIGAPSTWSKDAGVDITAPGGTPLLAVGAGTIVQEGISGFGPNAPILKLDTPVDGNDYAYYGHAGADTVPVGTHVAAGQQISEVGYGIVGISTGPHLEFGLSPSQSIPAVGATSATAEQLLKAAQANGGSVAANVAAGFHGGVGSDPVTSAADTAGNVAGAAVSGAASFLSDPAGAIRAAIAAVFSGFFDYVKSSLLKAVLYAALIGGGAALAVYGLTRGGRPQPTES